MYSLSVKPSQRRLKELPGKINTHKTSTEAEVTNTADLRCQHRVKNVAIFVVLAILLGLSVFFGLATVRCKEQNEKLSQKLSTQDPNYDDGLHLMEQAKFQEKFGALRKTIDKAEDYDLSKVTNNLWERAAEITQMCIVKMDTINLIKNGTKEEIVDVIGYSIDPNCLKRKKIVTQQILKSLGDPEPVKINRVGPMPIPPPIDKKHVPFFLGKTQTRN